ncbi:hypothetical protein C8F01DRAFT_1138259 [Mycena amicta]|nr:hypothetical protein C8F01DRAFT_1138259 [Mycena amicta]
MAQDDIEMGPISAMGSHPRPIDDTRTPGSRPHVKVTPWRLFNTAVLLGFGISKSVLIFHGETTAPNNLDWVLGVAWGLIAYWGSIVEAENPAIFPWLFKPDLTRPLSYLLWIGFVCISVVLCYAAGVLFVLSLGNKLAKSPKDGHGYG